MSAHRFACAAALTTLVIAAAPARAQPQPPPPRVGLELGFGLQAGKIFCEGNGCDDFTEAGGGNLNASYFVNPTLAVTGDIWVMAHAENNFTFAHYINTVGVKWRPVPVLTLHAGIGEAHATLDYSGAFQAQARSDNGFAVMGGAALDVLRGRRFALAIELRGGAGFYGDSDNDGQADVVGRNVGVGASLTWFNF